MKTAGRARRPVAVAQTLAARRGEARGWIRAGARRRQSLRGALGQGAALWLAGLLALVGGLSLILNPGADLRLVRWLVGLFLAGWGVLRLDRRELDQEVRRLI